MSGRTRHLRDGVLITNRKTDRRNPRRDPRDKLRELAAASTGPDSFPVRLVCRLPKMLEGLVAAGPHGVGVQVMSGGYLRIGGHSAEQCFQKAQAFFAAVAKDRSGFVTTAIVVNSAMPDQTYCRHLSVTRGAMVCSAGSIDPIIYEAA